MLLCFEYMVITKPQNRKSNSKQKTSPQSYKTQINILPFPGLAQTGTEQLGQGATLLGWPKSTYYFCFRPIFRAGKTPKTLLLRSLLHGNACYAGYIRFHFLLRRHNMLCLYQCQLVSALHTRTYCLVICGHSW